MENSKLSFVYWYMAMMFITSTKKSFSALEMQRQIGHKFYKPIWLMMHKIRLTMGKRDASYKLNDQVEIDEAFFVTTAPIERDQYGKRILKHHVQTIYKQRMKRGKGSPRNTTVLVMAESILNKGNKDKYRADRAVKFIKMVQIDGLKTKDILPEIAKTVDSKAHAITDGALHYNNLKSIVGSHEQLKMTMNYAHKVLPWVHKTISNAKRNFLGIHHSIGRSYTQNYLNEFCFKFNRRNNSDLFDRMMNVAVNYKWN